MAGGTQILGGREGGFFVCLPLMNPQTEILANLNIRKGKLQKLWLQNLHGNQNGHCILEFPFHLHRILDYLVHIKVHDVKFELKVCSKLKFVKKMNLYSVIYVNISLLKSMFDKMKLYAG